MSSSHREDLTNLSREALAERLHNEVKLQGRLTVLYDQCVGERLGLNPTDHRCLTDVVKCAMTPDSQPMTPGDLAKVSNLTTGAVTGVLDRLEHAGFVQREHDAEDRRRIIVRPRLERIHQELEPIWDLMTHEFVECCSRYTDDDLRLLIDFTEHSKDLLRRATERMQALEEPPAAT